MGKSFKGFSKALSLILAVAMVVTCVPTSAYAAELLSVDESEDLLIGGDSLVEESSDALVTDDASASEEKSSSLIDTQKAADLASAPEENTAGEEENEFTPDGDVSINLPHDFYVYKNDKTARADAETYDATSNIVRDDVNLTGAVYGTELTTVKYTVRARYSSGLDQDYSALDWKIMEGTDDITDPADINALTKEATLPEGLSIDTTGAVITISGRPLEVCPATYLYVVGTDRETDDTKSSPYKVVLPIDLTVSEPTIAITATDNTSNASSYTNKRSNAVIFNGGTKASPTPTKMGYTVEDENPVNYGDPGVPENVKPVTITVATTNLDTTYPMTVTASLEDDTNFQIIGTPSTRLDKNNSISIKVAPKTGLACGAPNKTYTTNLVLTSKGLLSSTPDHNVKVALSFTVKPDLAFTVKQGTEESEDEIYVLYMIGDGSKDISGMDLWEDAAGTTKTSDTTAQNLKSYYTKALVAGEVQVGKALDATSNITINATGGAGTILFDDFDDSALPDGLTASKTEGSKNSTLTFTGTPTDDAYTWSSASPSFEIFDDIKVKVKDNTSKATLNNYDDQKTYNGYVIKVEPADVDYANEDGEVLSPYTTTTTTGSAATGVTSYEYAWSTEDQGVTDSVYDPVTGLGNGDSVVGYYEYDGANYTLTTHTVYDTLDGITYFARTGRVAVGSAVAKFKVKNNSSIPLTINPEVYADTAEAATTDFAVVNKSITIPAGETGEVTVKNNTKIRDDSPIVGVLAITGDGIQKTHIRLEASGIEKGNKSIITPTVLPDTEVGEDYKITLKATPAAAAGKWTIVPTTDGDSSTGSAYDTDTNAKYLQDTYGIMLNKDTGLLYATPKKTTYASFPVQITVHNSECSADVTFTLIIGKASEGISLTSNGVAISVDDELEMAEIKGDSAVGSEAEITIANNTSVDIGDLTATIVGVTGDRNKTAAISFTENDVADLFEYFTLVTVDEDGKEVKTSPSSAAVTLYKDKNYALKVVSTAPVNPNGYHATTNPNPSELTPLAKGDDPYEVTVAISGANVATEAFTATLKVTSTFDIAAPRQAINNFQVGTEVKETNKENWTVAYDADGTNRGDYTFIAVKDKLVDDTSVKANPKADEVTFTWKKAASAKATDPDIKDSGLTFSEDGIIGGTPVKAGIYKVDVTATGHKGTVDYSGLVGTKEFTIEVKGSATLAVSAVVGASTQALVGNEVVVMQGASVGDTIDANSGFDVNVGATVKAITKGLKITVEDVDTRTAAEKDKEKDVHAGSTDFIGTNVATIASIAKDGHATFRVVPKSTAKAGDYLVKVTISGDEATTTYFFVEYIVSDALEISTAGASLTTGVGDDYRLMLESKGADNAAKIQWAEVRMKAAADIKKNGTTVVSKGSYVNTVTDLAGGSENDEKTENTSTNVVASVLTPTNSVTGLALHADQANPAGVDDLDLKVESSRAWIGNASDGRKKGQATLQGTFNVKIQAASDYQVSAGAYKTIDPTKELTKKKDSDTQYITRELKGKDGSAIAAGKYYIAGNGLNTIAGTTAAESKGIFGEQKATKAFTLTIGETEKVVVSDVTDGTTPAVAASIALSNDKKNDTNLATDDQKDMWSRAKGTYYSDGIKLATVTSYQFKEYAVNASPTAETLTLSVENGSGSQISRTATLKKGASSDFVFAAGDAAANINAGDTDSTIQVKPKLATLKKVGEYSDTLVISGDGFKNIEFPISIKVAAVTKDITLYQRGEKNATTTYDPKKDATVVEKNEKKANITFKPTVQNGTPAENAVIFFKNSGNVAIDYEVVEVKDATGATYTSASEKRKLYIGAGSDPTSTATLTSTLPANSTVVGYIKVQPEAAKTAGVQTAYLRFTYDTDQFVVVPVDFTVYETGLDLGVDVTPTDSTIEILKGAKTETDPEKKYYAEGADFKSVAPEFKIDNKNTGDASKALYDVTATLSSTADFEFVYSDATKINAGKDVLDLESIEAGANKTFKVAPKEGIRNGDHTVNVTIASPSLSTPIIKTVKITVNAGKAYSEKVLETTPTAIASPAKDAYRLYRGLVVSGKVADTYITVDSNTQVTASLDSGNLTLVFTLTSALADTNKATARAYDGAVTTATITKAGTEIGKDSFTVTLNATEKAAATAALAGVSDKSFFDTMNFDYYSEVEFTADPINATPADQVKFTDEILDLFGKDGVYFYCDANEDHSGYTDLITKKPEKANETGTKIGKVVIILPNNTSLGTHIASLGGTFPKATKAERAFEEWKKSGDTINANTIVKKDITGIEASWHSHKYSTDKNDTEHVVWTWTKLPSGKYTAKLTLYCTEAGCPDHDGSKVELTDVTANPPGTVAVTDNTVEATCEHGKSVKFTAEVTYAGNGHKYTSEYFDETGETQPLGHDWKDAEVKWADAGTGEGGAYTKADVTVTRTCKTDAEHVAKLTVVSVDALEKVEPKCEEAGSATYAVTYTDVDKFGKPAGNVQDKTNTKKVSLKAKGHNKTPELIVEGFDETTLKATVTAKCPDCGKELYKGELTATANADGTYKFTFTGVDEKTYEVNWSNHEHKWEAPKWTWASKDSATATFTCSVGKETKDVTATIVAVKTNSKGDTQYKATVTGPDGKEYSDLKWFDASGNPTSGEGIGIEGLADEYEYTGKPIKPAFTVVDYALDKVLVEGTDYSVSYKDNKKVGTATITIKGKNNYGEKGGEIIKQFKIVDPTAEEKPEDYFTVKSVKVASKDGFTYDGTEKYPATLTIKTSEGDVQATWDGSSYGLNVDSTKELKIFVTDNIKKGSGVVAVYGNNGKGAFVTKTATFSIKPCDLSTVSEEDLTITPDAAAWAVKGATPAVEVSYKGDVLVEGRDYTLSWKYTNKKDAGENAGEVTVKGKNNFTKKASAVKFNIDALDLNDVKFTVAAYDGVKAKAVKVVAYDQAGVVIPAKQYKVKIEKGGEDITTSKDALKNGDEITVTLEPATTNLDGSATANITVAANLAKVKVVVPKTFTKTYTGEPIELTSEDFESGKISVGSLEFGTDFEVVAYQNNVKKGTMTAYIQGVSDKCSGTGKIKVKIVPQKVKEDK